MRPHHLHSAVLLWVLLGSAVPLPAAPASTEPDAAPELLLFGEIPVVVTATRTERSVLEVPDAVSVIDAEEIRASGATSLAELLERVPGLELMRISASDLNASARGFNQISASNLLVMIDGRSVYLDFFGIVLWEQLPVVLQDIERIEIVRGPGSALYGANAFLGTVNIITRSTHDPQPLYLRAAIGPDTSLVSFTAARRGERAALKLSGRYRRRDDFRNTQDPSPAIDRNRHTTGLRNRLLQGSFAYRLGPESELVLSAGATRTQGSVLTAVGTYAYAGPEYYAKLDLVRGPWKLQGFFTRLDVDLDSLPSGLPVPAVPVRDRLVSNTADLEVQRELTWGRHDVLLGANLRRVSTRSPTVLGSRESDALYALFAQDEFAATDWLTAFLGARLDRHPRTGSNLSPRASLVARLGEHTRLRFGFARSFRNPTQILDYASLTLSGFTPAPTPLVQVQGNPDLDPEWVTAWSAGIYRRVHPRLSLRLDLFHHVLEDFQEFLVTSPGPPAVFSFRNQGRTQAWGGELGAEFVLSAGLRGFASYSWQTGHGPSQGVLPRQKASGGLRGRLGKRLRWALSGSWVGHTDYAGAGSATPFPERSIRSRFHADGFLGLRLTERFELGLHARNLLHQTRRQHPYGDQIGSELLLSGTLEF
jgi:iron complex outermembrane receptor protein